MVTSACSVVGSVAKRFAPTPLQVPLYPRRYRNHLVQRCNTNFRTTPIVAAPHRSQHHPHPLRSVDRQFHHNRLDDQNARLRSLWRNGRGRSGRGRLLRLPRRGFAGLKCHRGTGRGCPFIVRFPRETGAPRRTALRRRNHKRRTHHVFRSRRRMALAGRTPHW